MCDDFSGFCRCPGFFRNIWQDSLQERKPQQIHESSQKTVKTLTSLTKAILGNPKVMKKLGETLLPKNAPDGSLAKYLQDATTDKDKQKNLAKALKLYVRNPK